MLAAAILWPLAWEPGEKENTDARTHVHVHTYTLTHTQRTAHRNEDTPRARHVERKPRI